MKVKNVMFAGFAAAILSGVCGAASAADYNLVTEGYVTSKLAGKEDKGTSYTKTETDDLLNAKVSTETYAQYIEDQADVDAAQNANIKSNTDAINLLGGGEGGEGVATLMQDITALKKAVNDADGAVATKIAEAVADKAAASDVTALEGTVSGLSATVANKADTSAVNTLSEKVTALEDAGYQNETQVKNTIEGYGYQTEAQVEAEIAGATIAESQVSGLTQALAAKANASEVETALAGKAAVGASYTKEEADQLLGAKANTTDLDDYVETSTFEAYQGTVTNALADKQDELTEAQLLAVNSGIDATKVVQIQTNADNIALKANTADVNTALAGKLDDTMTAAGTYLVKRAENGDISYVSVEIVGATE